VSRKGLCAMTEKITEVWNLKMLRVGQTAFYLFRKYQFNRDYRNRSFRITSLIFLISSILQTNEEGLFHIGPSPITSTTQKIHYSLSSYATWFETISMLLHGTLTLLYTYLFIYLCVYKNFTIKKFEIFTVQHITLPKCRAADSSRRAV
jgi:hypothetical protein